MIYGNRIQPVTYQDEFTEFIKSLDNIQPINEFKINFSFRDIGKLIIKLVDKFVDFLIKCWRRYKERIKQRVLKEMDNIDFRVGEDEPMNGSDNLFSFKHDIVIIKGADFIKELTDIELDLSITPLFEFFERVNMSYDKLLNLLVDLNYSNEQKDKACTDFMSEFTNTEANNKMLLDHMRNSVINVNPKVMNIWKNVCTEPEMMIGVAKVYVNTICTDTVYISRKRFSRDYKRSIPDMERVYNKVDSSVRDLREEKSRCMKIINRTMRDMDDKSNEVLAKIGTNNRFAQTDAFLIEKVDQSLSEYIFSCCKILFGRYSDFASSMLKQVANLYNLAMEQYNYCIRKFR